MDGYGFGSWRGVVHFVSSECPEQAHVHFPVFAPAIDKHRKAIPGRLPKGGPFEGRRQRLLDLWAKQVKAVCDRFNLGAFTVENIKIGYCKDMIALEKKARYEFRPPVQDAMLKCNDSAEHLKAALDMLMRFLFCGGKMAYRRIRSGGWFGPKAKTAFFASLDLVQQAKEDDSDQWVSEGMTRLIGVSGGVCEFLIVSTGERFHVPRDQVQVSAHGCPYRWVHGGETS